MTDRRAHVPGDLIGEKYRVIRVLGEGGMGVVYEVTHELTKRRHALKLLHPQVVAKDVMVERFVREASAAGRIGNPHIVETSDAGRLPSGEPFLLLEYLEGQTLGERLRGTRGLALPDAVEIVAQACDGVAAAHEAGIVHRDLKPDNLFLTKGADGRPFVKILDFGIAKFDRRLTAHAATGAMVLGTPWYMPPEQMRGESSVDARADVYALGVIAWECLAGEGPYHAAADYHALVYRVVTEPEPRLSEKTYSLELVDAISRAMARDRAVRTASAQAFADELRAIGRSLPSTSAHSHDAVALAPTDVAPAPTTRDATVRMTEPAGPVLPVAEWPVKPARPSAPLSPRTALLLGLFGIGAVSSLVLVLAFRGGGSPASAPSPSTTPSTNASSAGLGPQPSSTSALTQPNKAQLMNFFRDHPLPLQTARDYERAVLQPCVSVSTLEYRVFVYPDNLDNVLFLPIGSGRPTGFLDLDDEHYRRLLTGSGGLTYQQGNGARRTVQLELCRKGTEVYVSD